MQYQNLFERITVCKNSIFIRFHIDLEIYRITIIQSYIQKSYFILHITNAEYCPQKLVVNKLYYLQHKISGDHFFLFGISKNCADYAIFCAL